MSPELTEALKRAKAWMDTATPEQLEAMWAAQRESWIRGMGPCEHGEYDWETCPDCLSASSRDRNGNRQDAAERLGPKDEGANSSIPSSSDPSERNA